MSLKIKKEIIFFCISIILVACSVDKIKDELKNQKPITTITIDPDNYKSIPFSEVFDSIEYIQLETDSLCLIGDVEDLSVFNNNFYIADNTAKSIFCFNNKGKFINKISKRGKGPGEYTSLSCIAFNYHLNMLLVGDDRQSKIIYYNQDMDFVNEIRLDICSFEGIAPLKNGCFQVFNSYYCMSIGAQLNRLSKNGKLEYSWLKFDNKKRYYNLHGTRKPFNYENNDSITFNYYYDNNIYQIKDNEVLKKYTIDFGKYNFPKSFEDEILTDEKSHEDFDNYMKMKRYCCIDLAFDTKNVLFISFMYRNKMRYALFSKNNRQTKFIDYEYSSNDIDGIDGAFIRCYEGNKIYGIFYPNSLKESLKEPLKQNLGFPIPDKLVEMINSLDENDNPIVAVYTLKKF